MKNLGAFRHAAFRVLDPGEPGGGPAPADAPAETPAQMEARIRAEIAAEPPARRDPPAATQTPAGPDPAAYFGALKDVFFDDPVEYTRRVMSDSVAAAVGQIRQEFGGVVQDHRTRQMVDTVGSGLSAAGQGYLREVAQGMGIDPANMDAKTRDILTRAARDYDREKGPPPGEATGHGMHIERPAGRAAPTITDEDRRNFGPYIDRHGEAAFLEQKKASAEGDPFIDLVRN